MKQFIALGSLGSLGLVASLDRQCKWKTFIHLLATSNNTHRASDEGSWKRKTNNTQRTTTAIHYGSTTRMKNGMSWAGGWVLFQLRLRCFVKRFLLLCVVLRKVMTVSVSFSFFFIWLHNSVIIFIFYIFFIRFLNYSTWFQCKCYSNKQHQQFNAL